MKRCTVIDMPSFKRLAKIISRRVDVQHSAGLERLSRASGHPNWHALQREYEMRGSDARIQHSAIEPRAWMEQVVEVFGPGAKDALSVEELLDWYSRAFGMPTEDEEAPVDAADLVPETPVASSEKAGAPTVVVTYKRHRRLQER